MATPKSKKDAAASTTKAATKSTTAKSTATKTAAKKSTAKKPAAKKTTTKKAPAKSTATKKTTAKKSTAKSASASQPAVQVTTDSKDLGIPTYVPAKGEEYMSDEQLEHFRQVLQAWKGQLMQDVDSTLDFMQDESVSLPDVNDRATQEEEFAVKLRTRDRERKLIRKIDKSIAEIDAGDYGFCETCGTEIGLRRLGARPTATQCIDCKTLAEIKEQQTHGGM